MNLDYSALHQPVTKADVEAYKATQDHGLKTATAIIGIVVTVFVLTFVVGALIISLIATGTINIVAVIIVLSIAGTVAAIVAGVKARAKKLARLYKFAQLNGLQMIANRLDPGYTGMIFDDGHTRTIREALVFNDGGEIGNYVYTTGSGKNQTYHPWSYVRIKLSRRLPHMVLDAKKNNLFFGKVSNLPDAFDRNQTLTLEGNFNDHFTLYAPKEYEHDALYVFTPDVMAAVIDAGQDYEMEVVDDMLMLYSQKHFDLTSEDQLQKVFAIINKIGGELRDQTDYYADERTANRQMNVVAEQGRRLKTSATAGTIISFIIFVVLVIWYVLNR